MKSLAEHLGVAPTPHDAGVDAPIASPQTIKAFCQGILTSPEYRASLMRRILLDELAPQVEALIYAYAEGKPVNRVEFKDTTASADDIPLDTIYQRIAFLQKLIDTRMNDAVPSPDDSEDEPPGPDTSSIH
jgi:hypothetical protein